jgi:hypothetical protein
LFADLLLTILSAILEGLPAVTDTTSCKIIALFRILLAACSFVLAVMTPYCIKFLNIYVLAVNILGVSSIILQVIATFTNGDKETLFELADLFMFLILWLSLFPLIWMFAQYAVDPARKLKRIQRAFSEMISNKKRNSNKRKRKSRNEAENQQVQNDERERELEDLKLLQNAKNANFLGPNSSRTVETKKLANKQQQLPKLEELLQGFSNSSQHKSREIAQKKTNIAKNERGGTTGKKEVEKSNSPKKQEELNSSMFFLDAAARERARRGKLYKNTIGSVATESGLPLRVGNRSSSNRSKKRGTIDQNDL